jgi:uncharacterized protein YlaI
VVRRNPTSRCSVCGRENPVDEMRVDVWREAAYRLFVCRRCAEQEAAAAEQEYDAA